MWLLNPEALELPLALHLLTSLFQFLRKIQGWHSLGNTSGMTLLHTSAARAWLDLSPLPPDLLQEVPPPAFLKCSTDDLHHI